MEAQGVDGVLKISDSALSIFWTSLRARLLSSNGAEIEVIPLNRIFEVISVPATLSRKGCFQIRILGNERSLVPINRASNFSNSLMRGEISHCMLFKYEQQLSFLRFENEVKELLVAHRRFIVGNKSGLESNIFNVQNHAKGS